MSIISTFYSAIRRGYAVLWALVLLASCNPEAPWTTRNVQIKMSIETVSSGFVEAAFYPNKDAYYLIAITEPWEGYDPQKNQKQFMQLALDSAYAEYLSWSNNLLQSKEFNVASFSSHCLQYGPINHFFTGLEPAQDYWIYAFPVNPETMKPAGSLLIETITTNSSSSAEVYFDYRIKDSWDYIYPVDSFGLIEAHYPYIATTRDSVELVKQDSMYGKSISESSLLVYFKIWETMMFLEPEKAEVYYGVKVIDNDGTQSSHIHFEEGHTYYTAITGFDGLFKHLAVYKFKWTKGCEYYFYDTDSMNLANKYLLYE